MKLLRNACTGQWPVHVFKCAERATLALGAVAVLVAAPAGAAVSAGAVTEAAAGAVPAARQAQPLQAPSPLTIADFYRSRAGAPLWLSPAAGGAAGQLVALLRSSAVDGLGPDRYGVDALQTAVSEASSGNLKAVRRADIMLSQAFVAYVDDLRRDPGVGITYVDPQLRPAPPSAMTLLTDVARASSPADYLRSFGWMHPIYRELRSALADHQYADDHERQQLQVNLQRARALPASNLKYVLVNAAEQRLYMYDGGKPVDSMVVVVGQPKWQTPMLTAYIRFAALNPYWYVPPDLAWEDVGQNVKKYGQGYFDRMGYEQVSDWTDNPQVLDATKIDWNAVRDGTAKIYLRQKPGPQNFMGRMKFMFPNTFGVYLHDNPRRDLFLKSVRYYSGGCVRLEDAARLGRWLFGHDLDWQSAGTEQPVPLAQAVPVYITYLTAVPQDGKIAFLKDAYDRDTAQLAALSAGTGAVAAVR